MLLTKVVCTLGPATSSPSVIDGLVRGGLDVARVNMSHGEPEEHAQRIAEVRRAAKEHKRPVGILVDLQGPKIRVGRLEHPVELGFGEEVVFAPEGDHKGRELPTTYAPLGREIAPGDAMLFDSAALHGPEELLELPARFLSVIMYARDD